MTHPASSRLTSEGPVPEMSSETSSTTLKMPPHWASRWAAPYTDPYTDPYLTGLGLQAGLRGKEGRDAFNGYKNELDAAAARVQAGLRGMNGRYDVDDLHIRTRIRIRIRTEGDERKVRCR